MIILTFYSHYAKRLNFSAHFAFFSPSFLPAYNNSRMARWSARRWAGRPPGRTWSTPAASRCRTSPRRCRGFHRFLSELVIYLASMKVVYPFPSRNCFQKCCLSSWGMDSGRILDSTGNSSGSHLRAGWSWPPGDTHWQTRWWNCHPECKQAPG